MVDLIIVLAYFFMMLFVGWRSRHQSAESYWVAGRGVGTGMVCASLVATIFGASSTMGIIGLGYARGLTGAWWALVGGIALVPFGIFLAGRVRALKLYTLPDILKKAYGEKIALPAGLVIATAWCGVIAAQLVAGARIIEGVFPIAFQYALFVVAIVFILYTIWGGQVSVIRTDSFQLLLFVGGFFVLFVLLALHQGPSPGLWDNVPADCFRFPASKAFGWYDVLVYYPLIVGLPYLAGPDIYSRIFCARDRRVARRATLIAAVIVIPLSFLLAFFGLLARAKFPGMAPETVLPKILEIVPMGLRALIVAGFLGTIMSSADTCLISASTILSLNVIAPFSRASKAGRLKETKAALLAVGSVSWLIASQKQGIIASLLLGYTVFVGGIVFPTLATFFRRYVTMTSASALWAIILGGGTAIAGKINGGVLMKAILTKQGNDLLRLALGPKYLSILPIITCLVVLILLSSLDGSLWKSSKQNGFANTC